VLKSDRSAYHLEFQTSTTRY